MKFYILLFSLFIVSCEFLKTDNSGGSTSGPIDSSGFNNDCGPGGNQAYKYSEKDLAPAVEGQINYGSSSDRLDPLAFYQWHLSSRGQTYVNGYQVSNDNNNSSRAGEVHNSNQYRQNGYRGRGVHVAVVDSGLEMRHEDLSTDSELSRNFYIYNGEYIYKRDPTPFAGASGSCDDHGTAVGGVIAAKSGNAVGGVGVAPSATLIGYNMIGDHINLNTENLAISIGQDVPKSDLTGAEKVDIYNYSIARAAPGPDDISLIGDAIDFTNELYAEGVNYGRGGKGKIYVKAAGNSFYDFPEEFKIDKAKCQLANQFNITCNDSNFDNLLTSYGQIVVSAANIYGKLTSYSSYGSNVFLAAPAGEQSADKKVISNCPVKQGANDLCEPAILTTDLMGCDRGYSRNGNPFTYNDFDFYNRKGPPAINQPAALNQNCNYFSRFNGTSAATPVVSGVAALLLEASPDLSWRQLRYVLAKSATKNDPDFKPLKVIFDSDGVPIKDISNSGYIIENAWQNNGAGYHFTNRYGFGLVNAKDAIDLVKSGNYPNLQTKSNNFFTLNWATGQFANVTANLVSNYPISDFNSGKINNSGTSTIINSGMTTIESVKISIRGSASDLGVLMLRLISPNGTSNIFLSPFSQWLGETRLMGNSFVINNFYGENPNGIWKLEAYLFQKDCPVDPLFVGRRFACVANITKADLTIYGH